MEKSLEAKFINDVLNIWRQYLSYAFQHLEATLILEVLQNKVGQSSRCSQNTHYKILTSKKKKKKKIPCLTKKIYHVPKFYSDQYLMSNKILHVKKKIFQWPTKIFPCPTQKIHTAIKNLSHTHVNKNVHTHEIRLTRSNKISTFIKNEFVQPSRHIKFSWLQCPQNSSQNTFNNTTK